MPRSTAWALVALLLTTLGLGACRQPPVTAPGDPVAAVRAQVEALRDNDLVRYSRLSLPPDLHARVSERWRERARQAGPASASERAEFSRVMTRLTAKDAEQSLYRSFEARANQFEAEIEGQWPMMKATGTIFMNAVVEANDSLSASEKEHAAALVAALMDWLRPELLTDRQRARAAIHELSSTARRLELANADQMQRLDMESALAKGSLVLAGVKRVAAIYGIDVDATLKRVDVRLVEAEGSRARVRVAYPLFDKQVSFEMAMVQRDGGWYGEDALSDAEADLAEPLPVRVAPLPEAVAPPPGAAAAAAGPGN